MRQRTILLFLFAVVFGLPAMAFNPKIKSGISDGTGTTEGNDGTDVRLPIGLPFQYTDVSTGSGSDNGGSSGSEEPARIVYSFDLTEEIGPSSLRQTHSALEQARNMNAACVLIRINSYAGATDAAENIRKELEEYDRPVIIFVDGKAVSAAALISMAGDSVYMRKGSGIEQSLAKTSRTGTNKSKTENRNNLNPQTVSVAGNQKSRSNSMDQSCIMSSSEAVRSHLANAETNDMNDVLARAGVNDCQVVYYTPGFIEKMIDWCMKPAVSLSILAFLAFAIRMQQHSAFPGPVTFLLLATIPVFSLPLFQGGLSSGIEIVLLLSAIILALIPALHRSSSRLLRAIPVLVMIGILTLCESGSLRNMNIAETAIQLLLTTLAFFTGWLALPRLSAIISRLNFRLRKPQELVSAS